LTILKLFNILLSSEIFPNIWNQGLITPIHKSGDKFDPNNYRGICINSNLGKILCIIINSREEQSRLFTVDVETGVLYCLMKLPVEDL
jgi:hypothetical protein